MSCAGVEIAVGQRWRTRSGGTVSILRKNDDILYPWEASTGATLTEKGTEFVYEGSLHDLVTLVQDEAPGAPEASISDEDRRFRDACAIALLPSLVAMGWKRGTAAASAFDYADAMAAERRKRNENAPA